jgi:hypothetical protein
MWRSGVVDDQMVSPRLTRRPTFHSSPTPDILWQQDRAVWRNRGDVRERAVDRQRRLTACE